MDGIRKIYGNFFDKNQERRYQMKDMIDLHSHILHGLDDGAKTLEESVEMCLTSFQDGVRTVVATPHTLNGVYQNDRSTILAKVQELNKEITKVGAQSSEFGVQETSSAFRILFNCSSRR